MVASKTYDDLVAEAGSFDAFSHLSLTRDGAVATIRMHDDASLNAFSVRMCGELRRALRRAEDDDAVRVLILTGSDKAFSAGGDIRQMRDQPTGPLETYEFIRREFGGVVMGIADMDKPVVAAVQGVAMGVGFFAALACDMVVASRDARFGSAYVHLALTPLGLSLILARSVGYHRAYEICALGEPLSGEEAHRLGLVNRLAEAGQVQEEAAVLARRLAAGPPRALAFCKQFLRQAVQADLEDHLAHGEAAQPLLLSSEDHQEAVAAFLDKREPVFRGR